MQLAGVCPMGARLLPRGRYSNEGTDDWCIIARGDEKLHRETAGLQCAFERQIRRADRSGAKELAGGRGGLCANSREVQRELPILVTVPSPLRGLLFRNPLTGVPSRLRRCLAMAAFHRDARQRRSVNESLGHRPRELFAY